MKKSLYTLLMLLMGITTMGYAQQEASTITEWNGTSKRLHMKPDSLITFSYKATENGTLYVYSDDQSVYDNVPVSIWGGWYHDGAYDPDSPLQETGPYENGVGVYGWIKVFAGDEIRFTLSTSKEAEGAMAVFSIKSAFFGESTKGDSWEQPIALVQDTKTALPVYKNYDVDYLDELSYATFCRFVAPTDGVASIFTSEYLIYYIEEELYGSIEEPLKYVSQDIATDDHEFVVEKDKAYIVIVPNSRPTGVTFKMVSDRLGDNCKAPIELTEFPATLGLVDGNNYYRIDLSTIGDKYMMDVHVASGWKGTITYLDNCDYESEELLPADINGTAANYTHNLDPLYMGSELIINFNVTNLSMTADAQAPATITLREAKEGECFDKAQQIGLGETAFGTAARDYWFVYTSDKDAELSVASTGTIKHILYSRGSGNMKNEFNKYRVYEGQNVYVCITAASEGSHTITLTEKAIEAGDYCDMPIEFELGDDIIINGKEDNAKDNFHTFVAEDNGFAIFTSTNWTVHFREECGGRRLNPEQTITEEGSNIKYTYKLPIIEGQSYIVEVEAVSESITITTRFEAANAGEVCATAIAITAADTIDIDYKFGVEKWYKITADKSGFYTINAKLGYAANMKTKVGDCDADESNAGSDDSKPNAYMGGYKMAKVYVEEGQTLYIYTKTGDSNDEAEFGANFYLTLRFAEPRPGERFADAIKAEPGVEYTLTTGADGYDTWYTYTLPAAKETTITIGSTIKNYSSLVFYMDEKTSLSAYKKDFTQTNIYNDEEVMTGKSYLFPALEAERTIYIKAPIATIAEPVVWKIEAEGDGEGIDTPQNPDGETIIYDLTGRRVTAPTKGIYIVNGRKVIFP